MARHSWSDLTPRQQTAVLVLGSFGARVLALGASVATTLALMGGMAAAPGTGTETSSPVPPAAMDPQRSSAPPQLHPTTAPPTTSSHAS